MKIRFFLIFCAFIAFGQWDLQIPVISRQVLITHVSQGSLNQPNPPYLMKTSPTPAKEKTTAPVIPTQHPLVQKGIIINSSRPTPTPYEIVHPLEQEDITPLIVLSIAIVCLLILGIGINLKNF